MKQYIVGIDLGTTNCAVAYAAIGEDPQLTQATITQLVSAGEIAAESLLPSFLYIPAVGEFVEAALSLPWNARPPYIVGRLAQRRGAENVSRLVASAKSWLSSPEAASQSPLLPPSATDESIKISPVEVSRQYLEHLRHSWNHEHAEARIEEQTVLITVPASFDAAAREATQTAARLAGYHDVILLEEPQAAFYSWIARNPDWREQVQPGDLVLVIDIGGGTTDFTLIAVTEQSGALELERVAVGEHILLGGDNMDLALARYLEHQLVQKGTKLDLVQFHALWQQGRGAKETLLAGNAPEEQNITLLGRGTGLIGGSIRTKVTRQEVFSLILEGFFPEVNSDASPGKARRSGLMEVGLRYASDVAVTKHLAQFLRRAGKDGVPARPTHVLFNGGVLQAPAIEQRLIQVLTAWLGAHGAPALKVLENDSKEQDLMHAVAHGAAYYGLARSGKGVRIRGGVPRTYYVGIESSMPAVPGLPAPMKALAVVPFGLEEGSVVELPDRKFALIVGEPADFRFFSSLTRRDEAGSMIEQVTDEFEELAPIQVTLPAQGEETGQLVPVTLESRVSDVGMLELWCRAADGRRWKLEFNVRERPNA